MNDDLTEELKRADDAKRLAQVEKNAEDAGMGYFSATATTYHKDVTFLLRLLREAKAAK